MLEIIIMVMIIVLSVTKYYHYHSDDIKIVATAFSIATTNVMLLQLYCRYYGQWIFQSSYPGVIVIKILYRLNIKKVLPSLTDSMAMGNKYGNV